MRTLGIFLGALLLSGCGATITVGGGYEPPVVNMTGVDRTRYDYDLNECTVAKKNASFVGAAQSISNCMEAKGYQIIEKHG